MCSTATNTKTTSDNQISSKLHINQDNRINTASSLSLYKKSLMSDISMENENLGDYDELNEYIDDEKHSNNSSLSRICDIFNLNSKLAKPLRFSSSNNNSERSSSQSPSSSIKSDYNDRTSKKKKKTKSNLKDDDVKRNQKQYRSAYLDSYLVQTPLKNVNNTTKSNKDLLEINNVNDFITFFLYFISFCFILLHYFMSRKL